MRCWLLLGLTVVTACAASHVRERVDGSLTIRCAQKKGCESRAERVCGAAGYRLIGGRHDQKIYGSPGHQVVVGKDELYVRCNSDKAVDAPEEEAGSWKLPHRKKEETPARKAPTVVTPAPVEPRPDASSSASAGAPVAAPPPAVCRPGETQRCVGPAACDGGQACLPDASGFGACDCGGKEAAGH